MIGFQSARALCLTRKLQFLRKVDADDGGETISSKTFMSLSDDIDSVYLLRDLECFFGKNFASVILDADTSCPHPREIKGKIQSRDCELRLAIHADRVDVAIIADVERTTGWPKLWDLALDYIWSQMCIECMGLNLVRILTFPPHAQSQSACPLCEEMNLSGARGELLSHVLDAHTTVAISFRF